MQNLGEDSLDVGVYCFRITSQQGCPDINIEYMLLYTVIKVAQIKDVNTENNHKVGFLGVYFL
jgi:hypothetical protein